MTRTSPRQVLARYLEMLEFDMPVVLNTPKGLASETRACWKTINVMAAIKDEE